MLSLQGWCRIGRNASLRLFMPSFTPFVLAPSNSFGEIRCCCLLSVKLPVWAVRSEFVGLLAFFLLRGCCKEN